MHFSNPWVLVETTMLISLSAAFVFRLWAFVCDRHGEWLCGELSTDVPSVSDFNVVYMAQYFQAASAPFVLGRMLFLTQVSDDMFIRSMTLSPFTSVVPYCAYQASQQYTVPSVAIQLTLTWLATNIRFSISTYWKWPLTMFVLRPSIPPQRRLL